MNDFFIVVKFKSLGEFQLIDDGRVLLSERAVVQELGLGDGGDPQYGQSFSSIFNLKTNFDY